MLAREIVNSPGGGVITVITVAGSNEEACSHLRAEVWTELLCAENSVDLNSHTLPMGVQNYNVFRKEFHSFFYKVQFAITVQPCNPTPGYFPKKCNIYFRLKTCFVNVLMSLFIIAKTKNNC